MQFLRRRPLTLLLGVTLVAAGADAQRAKVGERAPDFDLPVLGGGRVKLSKMRGHPVVIFFWTTYCPSCRADFPELVRAHEVSGRAGLVVLAVNGFDQEHNVSEVEKLVGQFRAPFQVALDKTGSARRAYVGRNLIPLTFFVDSAGIVRQRHIGPISRAQMDSAIVAILPRR